MDFPSYMCNVDEAVFRLSQTSPKAGAPLLTAAGPSAIRFRFGP